VRDLVRDGNSTWPRVCVAIALCIGLVACGGGSGSPALQISVSVTSTAKQVAAGGSAAVTAVVTNDSANEGVSWTLSCSASPCGTLSSSTTASGVSTTYSAPVSAPTSTLQVTITATSVADTSKSAVVTVTVPAAITISLQAPSIVPAGTTAQLSATVSNDPANGGVRWLVSCAVPSCGSIAPASSASGANVTYTAPTVQPTTDLFVTITAASVSSPAAQNSTVVTVPAITVAVSAGGTTIPAGESTALTATVTYDRANGGVTWSLTCPATACGSVAPTSSASGIAVTYKAPAAPPLGNLSVVVTATSASSAASQGSVTLTVPAIALTVVPVSALLPLKDSQAFTATASGDVANRGVTWALSQSGTLCAPACGTVEPTASASGAPVVYASPAALPAAAPVVVTATSVTELTSSATATVTLTTGSVSLVPDDLQFGGASPVQTAVLTNTGTVPLSIKGFQIGGTDPGLFSQANNCATSLAAGASCTITVAYSSGHGGTHTAVLAIADSSADSPQQLHLTGVGKASGTLAAVTSYAAATAPAPTGSSRVGTQLMHLVDAARADPYLVNGAPRELMVRFWYPTSGTSPCARASYTSPGVWAEFSRLLGTALPQIATNSCLDAPVTGGAHPVVVVTHGFTGTSTDYTFLAEDLASRGYVVAAVDHTYEATVVEFPDGRIAKSVFGSHLTSYTRSDPQALAFAVSVRLDDLRFVLDRLTVLNGAADGAMAGKLDLSRIALAGHSLGGLTTIRGVEKEPRFRAGISLDGLVMDRLTPTTKTPVLLVTAGRARWNENDCQLWSALEGGRTAVNLNGADHAALSDAVWVGNGAIATGDLGVERIIADVRDASAAFLDAVLSGASVDAAALRRLMNDPNAIVTAQERPPCGSS
jgi:predicted dienelactone hydrolase